MRTGAMGQDGDGTWCQPVPPPSVEFVAGELDLENAQIARCVADDAIAASACRPGERGTIGVYIRGVPRPTVPSDFRVLEIPDDGIPGYVEIMGHVDPLSLQAAAQRKHALMSALASAVSDGTSICFTGDVEVTIIWYVSVKRRYGTHIIADIDNIAKPMIDAVTGPDCVLIDDNQVQSLRASWETPYIDAVKFKMTIEALTPDQTRTRHGIRFVDFGDHGCYPVFSSRRTSFVGIGRVYQRPA